MTVKVKAIIIDDDIATLDGLCQSVDWERLGVEVVGLAQNGMEGLEQIRRCRPELILTDIYMPVMDGIEMLKQVRQEQIHSEVIILSGYEDFKYAKSAVKLQVHDYLSKPATLDEIEAVIKEAVQILRQRTSSLKEDKELRELLDSNYALIEQQFFKGVLHTRPVPSSYLDMVMEHLKLDLASRYFSVVMIEFNKNRKLLQSTPREWSLIEYAVNNIVHEVAAGKKGVYVVDMQGNTVTVIFSVPKQVMQPYVMQRAKQMAGDMMDCIEEHLSLPVRAAVGSVVTSIDEVHQSYKEAMMLLGERDNLIGNRIMVTEDLDTVAKTNPSRPVELYHALTDAIIMGQRELFARHVKTLMQTLKDTPNLSVKQLQEFTMEFFGILASGLYTNGIDLEELHTHHDAYQGIATLYTMKDLEDWLREIVHPIVDQIETRMNQKFKKTVDFMMQYVYDHYHEDVSLDIIANKLFLTRNYLSLIFKKATNENYNRFVTRVRMEKAKELIRKGNYKLYEVSEKVGYKNVTYFSSLFKKYTGCLPSEYGK